ncbi:hypothetical protein WAA20_07270 [Butyrivibrio fibrisolvens]
MLKLLTTGRIYPKINHVINVAGDELYRIITGFSLVFSLVHPKFFQNNKISAGEEESLFTRGYARMRRKGKYGKRRKTEST